MHVYKLLFVAKQGDEMGAAAIVALSEEGFNTQLLGPNDVAPAGSVAIYTGHNNHWPSRYMRIACHRFYTESPDWVNTPFVVSLRETAQKKYLMYPRGFKDALVQMATRFEAWHNRVLGSSAPWIDRSGPQTSYVEALEAWHDAVGGAIGHEKLLEILESSGVVGLDAGRGGMVVFHDMLPTGRVIERDSVIPLLSSNSVFEGLGLPSPAAVYGTSDVTNVFELLQLMLAALFCNMPAVFDTYPGAHSAFYWLDGFLGPSLHLLGISAALPRELGLTPVSKYTDEIDPKVFLSRIPSEYSVIAACFRNGKTLSEVYENAMAQLVTRVNEATGNVIQVYFVTMEDVLREKGLMQMSIKALAQMIEDATGHEVVCFNKAGGTQVTTGEVLSDYPDETTVLDIHAAGGWLGGAALYLLQYGLGENGGVVAMVKDSAAGRVNKLALPFLEGKSELHVIPAGLFRITAEGQNPDWSIDPIVLLQLLELWGTEGANKALRHIWEVMIVPMTLLDVGKKTVVTVTRYGIEVRES